MGGAGKMGTTVMEVAEDGVEWESFHVDLKALTNARFQAEMGPPY